MSEGNIKVIAKNIITSSPYSIYLAGLYASIVTGDSMYTLFTLSAIIMGDGFNAIEKKIFKKFMGSDSVLGKRPFSCGNNDIQDSVCTGCGIFPTSGMESHIWGMPSGHAQITSLAATFWSIYVWSLYIQEKDPQKKEKAYSHAITAISIMWILSLIVWTQRVSSGCHSVPQICMGIIFGIIFGFVSYYICTLLNKDMPKMLLSNTQS